MNKKHAFGLTLIVAALAIGSCKLPKEELNVDFVMKDFKAESTPGCNADSACATFEVQYPEFISLDTTVRKAISDRIIFLLNGAAEQPQSLEQMGNAFIADFKEFVGDTPGFDLGWSFRGHVQVLISSDTLISLQLESESFTGGAHAAYATTFVNVEPKTGTAYMLDAMLRPGYQEELNRLGEEELRNQLELGETDSLAAPELLEGDFKLTDNYGFRKEGIVFFFNDYELGSFLAGPVEIIIPYEKLQAWIR